MEISGEGFLFLNEHIFKELFVFQWWQNERNLYPFKNSQLQFYAFSPIFILSLKFGNFINISLANLNSYLYYNYYILWFKFIFIDWFNAPISWWSEDMPPTAHFFLKDFIYLFLERGEGREKERERNISVWLPLVHPLLGTCPATQACPLTGNRTSDPLVIRLALNPLSHTSQGPQPTFEKRI